MIAHEKEAQSVSVIWEMQSYNDILTPTRNDCNPKDNTKCW